MLAGLTGGIACGKTTVARLLIQKGALVVDADQVARDVVQPGSAGLLSIVEAFGHWVLTGEGFLNRPALSNIFFLTLRTAQSLKGSCTHSSRKRVRLKLPMQFNPMRP